MTCAVHIHHETCYCDLDTNFIDTGLKLCYNARQG